MLQAEINKKLSKTVRILNCMVLAIGFVVRSLDNTL
jgi:hypothetical protein